MVKKGSASPRSAPVDEKKEEKKAVKEVEPVGGKRKKGKKVEEEQKEDVNPFSTAPMMIHSHGVSALGIRASTVLDSINWKFLLGVFSGISEIVCGRVF